jgi:hypothetical protein
MSFSSTPYISEEMYLRLKVILEVEHSKPFDIEDVREIADSLVDLYLLLEHLEVKRQIRK